MNQAMENLLNRRSVRQYKNLDVPKELITRIVEAGLYAPSGMGKQNTIILVVTDPDVRNALARDNADVMGQEGSDPFYGAPVVLVVLAPKDARNGIYDGSCVLQNLMLAAHAQGLASCWIHRAKQVFDEPKWQEYLHSLGIEGSYEGIGHCIIGYPDGEIPKAEARAENRVFFAK